MDNITSLSPMQRAAYNSMSRTTPRRNRWSCALWRLVWLGLWSVFCVGVGVLI